MAQDEENAENSNPKKRKSPLSTKQRKKQKIQAVDALPWKELSLPENLDDYEGFFGLEEVDNVDIVRDEAGGLSFRHKGTQARGKPGKKEKAQGKTAPVADEVEWEGFEDEEESRSSDAEALEGLQSTGSAEKQASVQDLDRDGNQFSALESTGDLDTETDVRAWRNLELSDDLLSSLAHLGFSQPTPIQSASIPLILEGRDLIGKAPTGSGKTLAFGLPIIEKWLSKHPNKPTIKPTALIIEPTRELAHQIERHLKALHHPSHARDPQIATLTGGLSIHKQKRLLATADIVIATPGRLWDLLEQDKPLRDRIKQISTLVIDEADRLLSQGHFQELEQILNALDRVEPTDEVEADSQASKDRQTLVFSATFAKELQQKLARKAKLHQIGAGEDTMAYLLQKLRFREQPKFVDVNPTTQMAPNLTEALLEVADTNKDLYLYALLLLCQPHSATRALVFVNSVAAVRRVVPFLQHLGFNALPLHSNMEQKARLRSIERFTATPQATNAPRSSMLVATDVAARGLDIPEVHVVIHYHLPRASDMYVHRSGRTARAAAYGASILMSGPHEAAGVRRLVAQVHAGNHARRSLQLLSVEDRIVQHLRPRAQLAKKIADAEQAKERLSATDTVMQKAADDLGVDVDGEAMDFKDGRSGRGKARKQREEMARGMTKAEMKGLKFELRQLLAQRINTGVNKRYLANGKVDMGALLAEQEAGKSGGFLGHVDGLQLQIDAE